MVRDGVTRTSGANAERQGSFRPQFAVPERLDGNPFAGLIKRRLRLSRPDNLVEVHDDTSLVVGQIGQPSCVLENREPRNQPLAASGWRQLEYAEVHGLGVRAVHAISLKRFPPEWRIAPNPGRICILRYIGRENGEGRIISKASLSSGTSGNRGDYPEACRQAIGPMTASAAAPQAPRPSFLFAWDPLKHRRR